jgi:hypothetical protein
MELKLHSPSTPSRNGAQFKKKAQGQPTLYILHLIHLVSHSIPFCSLMFLVRFFSIYACILKLILLPVFEDKSIFMFSSRPN